MNDTVSLKSVRSPRSTGSWRGVDAAPHSGALMLLQPRAGLLLHALDDRRVHRQVGDDDPPAIRRDHGGSDARSSGVPSGVAGRADEGAGELARQHDPRGHRRRRLAVAPWPGGDWFRGTAARRPPTTANDSSGYSVAKFWYLRSMAVRVSVELRPSSIAEVSASWWTSATRSPKFSRNT